LNLLIEDQLPDTDRIRVGLGTSDSEESALAGFSAAVTAVSALEGEQPALILVYASVSYDLPALLDAVRAVTGETPLAGATTNGYFHGGVVTPPGGVAVLALTAGPYRFGVGSATGVHDDAFAAGRTMARAARQAAGPARSAYAAVLMLVDGMVGNQQALLNGIHKVVGAAVPVVGGVAGDSRLCRTSVFHGDRILSDGGAVAIWLDSPWPLTVVADHGWQAVGLPLLVTKADGSVVHEVAGRPAVEVFHDQFRRSGGQGQGWACMPGDHESHAFGIIEPDGSQLIRGAYLDDSGVLRTFCPLPTYTAIQIVSCQPDDLLDVVDGIVKRTMDGRDAGVLLAFSCVARLDILRGHGTEGAEVARLQAAAGPVPTFGFYTHGEFARTGRVAGFHNFTLAAIAL
jgi:hypothetical protein